MQDFAVTDFKNGCQTLSQKSIKVYLPTKLVGNLKNLVYTKTKIQKTVLYLQGFPNSSKGIKLIIGSRIQ